jgi:hypothetical protein
MRNRKIAIARHCRRGPASVYPAIRDGWPAGARKLKRLGGTLARETAIPAGGGLLIAMRQALQLLPWLRKELGIAEATKDEDHQEEAREGEAPR